MERKIATVSARSKRQMLGSWRPRLICHTAMPLTDRVAKDPNQAEPLRSWRR